MQIQAAIKAGAPSLGTPDHTENGERSCMHGRERGGEKEKWLGLRQTHNRNIKEGFAIHALYIGLLRGSSRPRLETLQYATELHPEWHGGVSHARIFGNIPHWQPSTALESIPCRSIGRKGGISAKSWANAGGNTDIDTVSLGARPWLSTKKPRVAWEAPKYE